MWHVCSPIWRPLLHHHSPWADDLLSLQPHATPAHALCLHTPRKWPGGPDSPLGLQTSHCLCGSKHLGVPLLQKCARLCAGQTNAHPHPIISLKTLPFFCPLPFLVLKPFPAVVIWIGGALRRKEGIWHRPRRLTQPFKLLPSWKCPETRLGSFKKQIGEIDSTPQTGLDKSQHEATPGWRQRPC